MQLYDISTLSTLTFVLHKMGDIATGWALYVVIFWASGALNNIPGKTIHSLSNTCSAALGITRIGVTGASTLVTSAHHLWKFGGGKCELHEILIRGVHHLKASLISRHPRADPGGFASSTPTYTSPLRFGSLLLFGYSCGVPVGW